MKQFDEFSICLAQYVLRVYQGEEGLGVKEGDKQETTEEGIGVQEGDKQEETAGNKECGG